MATYIRLQLSISTSIKNELFEKLRQAECMRKKEYESAVKIQSWFRGIKLRAYLKFLNHCATVIQRHYRGHLGRAIYYIKVQNAVTEMRERYYNAMATKIQKTWKGFYVRKFIHNYYSRKRYLEGLKNRNSIVRKELEVWRISLERGKEIEKQKTQQSAKEEYNKRHHYLISTEQIPGIYNSPFSQHLTSKEYDIRSSRQRGYYNPKKSLSSSTKSVQNTTLPPLKTRTVQGPFRSEEEVRHQRHRPLNSTLRVETCYTSVEESREKMKANEWLGRVIDKPFQPFTRCEQKYTPLIHTKSSFGRQPYGNQHFREKNFRKHVSSQNFNTAISPIPIFDQFGKTY